MVREKIRVAIIGYVWPEPQSSAAGFRTCNLLQIFGENDFEVFLLSPAKTNNFDFSLIDSSIKMHAIELNHSSFDRLISEINPDFVIFDRFITEEQFGARVKTSVPNAVRIIDSQDFHSLRLVRHEILNRKKAANEISATYEENVTPSLVSALLDSRELIREIAAFYRSDLTLIISKFEFELLEKYFNVPSNLLHYFPFVYPNSPNLVNWNSRKHFCFLGNFRHSPNFDAVLHLVHDLWPQISLALPQTELHLYGAYPSKEVMQLNCSEKRIFVFGPIEDHRKMFTQYRLNLAPLRFGAGIKGKIADAWYSGTPTITTNIGAEGMGYTHPQKWGGEIALSTKEFVTAAIHLYQEEISWNAAQNNGRELLHSLFNYSELSKKLLDRMEMFRKSKEEHRQKNIIGKILWHELYRSTDYFSRWLELKSISKDLN